MDVEALRRRVPEAKLVLGDIQHNIGTFLEEYDPSPIGAIFNDTDYWSSTRESFRLFDQASTRPQNFLPRQFLYFDDIIGREYEMYGPFNGQLLAIDEYNAAQDKVRIHRNQNLMQRLHIDYRWQIYYAHLFRASRLQHVHWPKCAAENGRTFAIDLGGSDKGRVGKNSARVG
jgi:hypothetical protein